MPGIADSPVAPLQLNSAAHAGDFKVTPGVGDLMKAFKDGFITVEDITKRALDKPLENAQRSQDLQDTNIIRPKKREVADKQLDVQSATLDEQAKALPRTAELSASEAELTMGKVQEAMKNFQSGGDVSAFADAWRQFFPGQPLPRTDDGKVDYTHGTNKLQVESDRLKRLGEAKAGAAHLKTSTITEHDPNTGEVVTYSVTVNELTGAKGSRVELGREKAQLNEQQAGSLRYSTRMGDNEGILGTLEQGGFDPTTAANTAKTFLFNRLQGDKLQSYTAAKNNWIAANLRKESGAAISAKEYADAGKQYFPADGDGESVVKEKKQRRDAAEQAMYDSIGPSVPRVRQKAAAAPAVAATSADAPVSVNTPAEAPATAKFILMPNGRTYKNPKYIPTP